ncbi:hypothetical protein NECID01_1449 [Nematocida sp. AWRm77]|nr:hypothetical protein NECID01_1449 [Nematocida sp. AWRm77]
MEFNLTHAQQGEGAGMEILEFKGEFVLPEEMDMSIEDTTVHFSSSFIKGTRESSSKYAVFERENGALALEGVCTEKVLFLTPPRYVCHKKKTSRNFL